MKRGRTILAGGLFLILACGAPAMAQESTPDQDVAETTTMLLEKLGVLAEGLGIDAPALPRDVLTSALSNALPILPAGEPGLIWSSGYAFDFNTSYSTGELEPDEKGRTVLTDARGCLEADDTAEVVHFQRFSRGGMRGHRCVTAFGGTEDESVWVIHSRTFAEGPNRRLDAFYAVATSIEGDPERARRVLEDRLDENVALAGIMADYALELVLAKEAASAPLTEETLAERVDRLQGRLADIAASFETLAP